MPGQFAYSTVDAKHTYPSPVLMVTLRFGRRSLPVLAVLDSGADGTTIPQIAVNHLKPQKVREVVVEDANGNAVRRQMYILDVDFAGTEYQNHPVILLPTRSYMLIGRDILRNHRIVLNGPQSFLEIG